MAYPPKRYPIATEKDEDVPKLAWLARQTLRWTAFLALPGVLWIAFELYGLTLFGPQMLFFSVAHTMPLVLIAIYLAVPLGGLWLVQSAAALLSHRYRKAVCLDIYSAQVFMSALALEALLLLTYQFWSQQPLARIPLCTIGLVLTALLVRQTYKVLWRTPAILVAAA